MTQWLGGHILLRAGKNKKEPKENHLKKKKKLLILGRVEA